MNLNPTLSAWLDGCTRVEKDFGGYTFIWVRPDGCETHKVLRNGSVKTVVFAPDGTKTHEGNLMPIDIGIKDIIKASPAIKRSGKLKK